MCANHSTTRANFDYYLTPFELVKLVSFNISSPRRCEPIGTLRLFVFSYPDTYDRGVTLFADLGNFEIPTRCLTNNRSSSELQVQVSVYLCKGSGSTDTIFPLFLWLPGESNPILIFFRDTRRPLTPESQVMIMLEYPSRSNLNCLFVVLRCTGRGCVSSLTYLGLSTSER